MNLIRLARHQHPNPPHHELRQKRVLDREPPHRARVNLAADRRGKRPAARLRTPEAVERKTTLLPGPPPRLHPPPFLCVKRAQTPGKG